MLRMQLLDELLYLGPIQKHTRQLRVRIAGMFCALQPQQAADLHLPPVRLEHAVSGILGASPKSATIHLDRHHLRCIGRSGRGTRRGLGQHPLRLHLFPGSGLLLKLLLHLLRRSLRESMDLPFVDRPL